MNSMMLISLAFTGGAAIALQASMNAQLGVLLGNSLLSSVVAFASGLLFCSAIVFVFNKSWPSLQTINGVPVYLWFVGGILSTFALTSFYWLIPKMGVAVIISAALTGQLIFSVIASHYGWFGLPVTNMTTGRMVGCVCLFMGLLLINQ